MNPNTDKKLIGAGVLSAFAASLCCITPVLAFLSGATGRRANTENLGLEEIVKLFENADIYVAY